MQEHQRFEEPILTPTTKAPSGHDEDITREEIIRQGLVSEEEYEKLETYALALFKKGTEMAAEKGLILVDTKYEFGKKTALFISLMKCIPRILPDIFIWMNTRKGSTKDCPKSSYPKNL